MITEIETNIASPSDYTEENIASPSDYTEENTAEPTSMPVITQTSEYGGKASPDKTLNISILNDNAVNTKIFATLYTKKNPDISIIINDYKNDGEQYLEQITLALAAGTADDMMEAGGINYKDAQTIQYLTDFKQFMKPFRAYNKVNRYMSVYDAFSVDDELYIYPLTFIYSAAVMGEQMYKYYFAFEEETPEAYPKPLTDKDGRLIIDYYNAYIINGASGNKKLAWDFLQYMEKTLYENHELQLSLYEYPVNKESFNKKIANTFDYIIDIFTSEGFLLKSGRNEQKQAAIEQMDMIFDMPMTAIVSPNDNYKKNVAKIFNGYYSGVLIAEEAAAGLWEK